MRYGSITTGLWLVALGSLLLLNNLGIVGWSVWAYLLRWWPVILIAVGLQLVFRRHFLSLVILLLLLGGTAYYIYAGQPSLLP